jgi:hypothetical protein
MWLSINTVSAKASASRTLLLVLSVMICLPKESPAQIEGLRVAATVVAQTESLVFTTGRGKATLYLVGPSHSSKRQIELGQEVQIKGDEISSAGRYLVVLCSTECRSESFYVTPARAASLSFLAHPSRVPVRADNAISGVVFAFDGAQNLILEPIVVTFKLTAGGGDLASRSVSTQNGVAWLRTSSGSVAGTAQLAASSGNIAVRRLVRQVAADACNLRVKATRTVKGVALETDPVRDCSGNLVPDGTIVTFTKTDDNGKSTVDAPVKQGVARAQMMSSRGAISVASGIVMGNSIRLGESP